MLLWFRDILIYGLYHQHDNHISTHISPCAKPILLINACPFNAYDTQFMWKCKQHCVHSVFQSLILVYDSHAYNADCTRHRTTGGIQITMLHTNPNGTRSYWNLSKIWILSTKLRLIVKLSTRSCYIWTAINCVFRDRFWLSPYIQNTYSIRIKTICLCRWRDKNNSNKLICLN